MDQTLRDGSSTKDRRLDRIAMFDRRSLDFPVQSALNAEQQKLISKRWSTPPGTEVLNQGREGACFPTGMLITLADGTHRPIEDIRLLDRVVTAEGRTGTVTQLMARPANRGLVNVKIEGHLPLRCTPEHPVLTQRGYVAAEDLVEGDTVAITRWAAENDEPIRPRELVNLSAFRGVVSGVVNTGGVLSEVAPLPELLARTPSLGRLLGLYAAEGHTTVNKVVFTFGAHEESTLVAETIALIKTSFDVQARVQLRRANNAINVNIYGKAWRLLFESLVPGTTKHGDKHLSAHVTSGPASFRQAVLSGWLDGDGHRRRTERTATTVSRRLGLDMHGIASALGLQPVLRQSAPSQNRHAQTRQTRYDFGFGIGGGSNRSASQDVAAVWRRVCQVTQEDYNGHVYNLEVEGDHSYVADGVGVHNCVGFGVTHELMFYPVPVRRVDATFAREKIYWVAQEGDPWPGGSYPGASPAYEGTSVLYGVKAAADLGYYKEYRWATSENELALGVGYLGPAIIGVDWYEGMFEPDSKGFIRPTGEKMGGHCCLIIGINIRSGHYVIRNSWGPTWGDNGNCKISREDMSKLIRDNGEACIISQRTIPAPGKKDAAETAAEIITD